MRFTPPGIDPMKLKSPAKINLFLEILDERSDGYHEIETLITAVSMFDELTLEPTDETHVRCEHSDVPEGPENLVHRAIRRFRAATGLDRDVTVTIDKTIPPGSGLGGGSSNAAAVLRGLNQLTKVSLSPSELMDIGKQVGSDVNFFLNGHFAVCRGRGERVEETSLPFPLFFLVILPPVSVKTPIVYKKSDEFLTSTPKRVNIHLSELGNRNIDSALFNRLYEPAIAAYPSLDTWFQRVRDLASLTPHLSGSGSAIFLAHSDRDRIREESSRLDPLRQLDGVSIKKTRSLNRNWDPFCS